MTEHEKEQAAIRKLITGDELAAPIVIMSGMDVVRIARRDFPAGQVAEVLTVLGEYGMDALEWMPHRIRLAALRQVAGNLEFLKVTITFFKSDCITSLHLIQIEYPCYFFEKCLVRRFCDLPEHEWQQIIDADRKEYQDWFDR